MRPAWLVLAAWAAGASPATAAEPKRTVLLENERVRISEVAFEPGDAELDHTHTNEVVAFFLTAGALDEVAGGKVEKVGGKAGDYWYMAKGITHRAENRTRQRIVLRTVMIK